MRADDIDHIIIHEEEKGPPFNGGAEWLAPSIARSCLHTEDCNLQLSKYEFHTK